MITQSFLDSPEYQGFKEFMEEERKNSPVKISTKGKTNEMIAREVTAHEIACRLLDNTIRKFERQVKAQVMEKKSYK